MDSVTMPRVAALMIGRGGSSLKDKNVLPVLGVPLLLWAAAAAHRSRYVSRFYISSDDDKILSTAGRAGYTPIRRPGELASATAQSCDAVRHALNIIEQDGAIDILVVQHANVGTITEQQIDDCIDILMSDPTLTAVVPSHDKAEYHPMRAKRVMADGTLEPFVSGDGKISANRQDLPKCLFFDHSFWVLRGRTAAFDPEGQGPWNCMGRRISPYETHGCLDVHDIEDIDRTAAWIQANGVPKPDFA
jgi:CMP-N-acetylneuraminic acid synthetase